MTSFWSVLSRTVTVALRGREFVLLHGVVGNRCNAQGVRLATGRMEGCNEVNYVEVRYRRTLLLSQGPSVGRSSATDTSQKTYFTQRHPFLIRQKRPL